MQYTHFLAPRSDMSERSLSNRPNVVGPSVRRSVRQQLGKIATPPTVFIERYVRVRQDVVLMSFIRHEIKQDSNWNRPGRPFYMVNGKRTPFLKSNGVPNHFWLSLNQK